MITTLYNRGAEMDYGFTDTEDRSMYADCIEGFRIECDWCSVEEQHDIIDFKELLAYMTATGWRNTKSATDEWRHKCPECCAEEMRNDFKRKE